ncbi:MAG TPA: ATP synthase F1 subunit delta [Planctomycetota bacterium]|nr:ATP synthase F1 subunit delta [Planctomycetota bacterium]
MGDTAATIRYAEALYELAKETGKTAEILLDLAELKLSFEAKMGDYLKLIHARVPLMEKLKIAESSFLGDRDPFVRNTVLLMIRRNRQNCLARLFSIYLELHEEREGVMRLLVETAKPLSDEVAAEITQRLQQASGRKVVIEAKTDASLLGGMRFRVGSKLVDATLKTQLDRLHRRLKSVSVEAPN